MKYFIMLFLLFLTSCQSVEEVEEPGNLISEDNMVAVLTDLSILNSAKNYNRRRLEETGVKPEEMLFEKHGIDSLQLAQSTQYYAKKYNLLEGIYKKVRTNLEQRVKILEIKQMEEMRIQDSIQAADSIALDSVAPDSIKLRVNRELIIVDSIGPPALRNRPIN